MLLSTGNDEHRALPERLMSAPIAWLSTTRRDGSPQSVPVWFAWTDRAAVVFSEPPTAKVAHLRARPRCVLALETEDAGNDVVLLDAEARIVDDGHPEVVLAAARFAAKYESSMGEGFAAWRTTFKQPLVLEPVRLVAWSKPDGKLRHVLVTPAG